MRLSASAGVSNPCSPQPCEHVGALGGRLLRRHPANERGSGEALRIVRGQPHVKAVADQHRINHVDGAGQEPVPAMALCQACEPVPPQSARHQLSGASVQKRINRCIEIFIRRSTQVAPQSRRDQVVVNGIVLESGRIRNVRLTQADTLHRRHEFRARDVLRRRHCRLRAGRLSKQPIVAAPMSAFSQFDIPALWWLNGISMKSKVVAILETRTGAHLAELVARRGGVPMLAPALQEVPDIDAQAMRSLLTRWRADPFKICIFQTGVGTKALFSAADAADLGADLQGTPVGIAGRRAGSEARRRTEFARNSHRHPAPLRHLPPKRFSRRSPMSRSRGLRFWCSAMARKIARSPRDWRLAGPACRRSPRIAGPCPRTRSPCRGFSTSSRTARVDAVVFTSAVQMHNLYSIAQQTGSAAELANNLNRSIVASIGPVCSRALRDYGVAPAFEANPPKLGPLIAALDTALSVSLVGASLTGAWRNV